MEITGSDPNWLSIYKYYENGREATYKKRKDDLKTVLTTSMKAVRVRKNNMMFLNKSETHKIGGRVGEYRSNIQKVSIAFINVGWRERLRFEK